MYNRSIILFGGHARPAPDVPSGQWNMVGRGVAVNSPTLWKLKNASEAAVWEQTPVLVLQ